ncbi:MAG: DUF4364 family protein [Clostridia bacterium]|nr:DUF4364 family protein [Clostridia bacterium]
MENDAIGAGVRNGGLFSTTEIRILICYILNSIKEPVPAAMLSNILHFEGIANGFEVSDALAHLEKNGQISPVDDEGAYYEITPSGSSVADELDSSLSLTVRKRAYIATLKMLAKIKNAKGTRFRISSENGYSYITCTAIDGKVPLIEIKMLIPDEKSGTFIREKFLENPSEIFSDIIKKLSK